MHVYVNIHNMKYIKITVTIKGAIMSKQQNHAHYLLQTSFDHGIHLANLKWANFQPPNNRWVFVQTLG